MSFNKPYGWIDFYYMQIYKSIDFQSSDVWWGDEEECWLGTSVDSKLIG